MVEIPGWDLKVLVGIVEATAVVVVLPMCF